MVENVGYLVAIIFFVLALNLYITFRRINRVKKSNKKSKIVLDEEKQAIWRDKEVARRIAKEQEDCLERINLRNETLAFYEEVRRRHAKTKETPPDPTNPLSPGNHDDTPESKNITETSS